MLFRHTKLLKDKKMTTGDLLRGIDASTEHDIYFNKIIDGLSPRLNLSISLGNAFGDSDVYSSRMLLQRACSYGTIHRQHRQTRQKIGRRVNGRLETFMGWFPVEKERPLTTYPVVEQVTFRVLPKYQTEDFRLEPPAGLQSSVLTTTCLARFRTRRSRYSVG